MKRAISVMTIFIAQFFASPAFAQDVQKLDLYLETGHTQGIWTGVFSQDGKTFSSIGGDKTMKLWDVESGRELDTARGLGQVEFSAHQTKIASLHESTLKLWDVKSSLTRGSHIMVLPHVLQLSLRC